MNDVKMTRQQKRAADAAELVQKAKQNLTPKEQDRFSTLAHAIPLWIRTNGLLQTVVFLEAKSERPEKTLESALATQLRGASFPSDDSVLSRPLTRMAYDDYCRWQEEAIHCAVWIKRFAAALIGPAQR